MTSDARQIQVSVFLSFQTEYGQLDGMHVMSSTFCLNIQGTQVVRHNKYREKARDEQIRNQLVCTHAVWFETGAGAGAYPSVAAAGFLPPEEREGAAGSTMDMS
jgi:hypothetical protein